MSELGTPFVLEGLFGDADAEAMDAEPDLDPDADSVSMDVEDDAAEATADGGMIVDGEGDSSIGTLCVFHQFFPRLRSSKKVYQTVDVPDMTDTDANANALTRHAPIAQGRSQI